jgi:hypothetical protein
MTTHPTGPPRPRLPMAPVDGKCQRCPSLCCRYLALQIDGPKSYDDFDLIRWYVAHHGVQVYKDRRRWYLQVDVPCRHLDDHGRCQIYPRRPKICADHRLQDCEFENDGPPPAVQFRHPEEVEAYLQRRWPRGRPGRGRRRSRSLPAALFRR